MNESEGLVPKESDFLLYTAPDGDVRVDVFFHDETVWLTQKRLAELFGVDVRTINEHIQNIYKNQELQPEATTRKFRIVQKEGARDVNREIEFYAEASIDYDKDSEITQKFYKTVQNKLHWAITGSTAAEFTSLTEESHRLGKKVIKDWKEVL